MLTFDILTDLGKIHTDAIENERDNDRFISFLKTMSPEEVDLQVHELSALITPKIDCTQCGNCCRSLMIQIEDHEIINLSRKLHIPEHVFVDQYVEKGSGGQMIINTIPCHFLENNHCRVYEDRFSGCREFPALHLPHITSRLFTIFMHYGRCPIIYNVIEALKNKLSVSLVNVTVND